MENVFSRERRQIACRPFGAKHSNGQTRRIIFKLNFNRGRFAFVLRAECEAGKLPAFPAENLFFAQHIQVFRLNFSPNFHSFSQ